jgi:hypothetical protein
VRELTIDWAALHSAFQMPMPEVRCFLVLKDGKVLKVPPGDPGIAVVQASPGDFVAIDAVPSRIQYQWVDEFSKTIEDETLRARVEAAINGKGAFRRFKDILLTMPDERRRWFEFRDQKMRQRVVEWVREKGVLALNDPPWLSEEGAASTPAPARPQNQAQDIEALRDFLISWFDGRDAAALAPLELERLAAEVGKAFVIKPQS